MFSGSFLQQVTGLLFQVQQRASVSNAEHETEVMITDTLNRALLLCEQEENLLRDRLALVSNLKRVLYNEVRIRQNQSRQ